HTSPSEVPQVYHLECHPLLKKTPSALRREATPDGFYDPHGDERVALVDRTRLDGDQAFPAVHLELDAEVCLKGPLRGPFPSNDGAYSLQGHPDRLFKAHLKS